MKGYYKNPEATAETIDSDGWLHSGDKGEIDAHGYVKITGRIKELYVSSGGKNIAPLVIEETMKSIPMVSQCMLIGDGRKSDWVKKQIKLRNLEENVIMLGKFEVNRMPSFFKHADALLVSLKDEPIFSMTIPTKILSYLRSGIPIIGMLNGEGADLIKENKAGFFSSAGDYHGLTEIIKNLVSMPSEQRNLIGKNGINLSNKNFNRTLLMNKLESWLLELVDK